MPFLNAYRYAVTHTSSNESATLMVRRGKKKKNGVVAGHSV